MRKAGTTKSFDLSYTVWGSRHDYFLWNSYDLTTFNHPGWKQSSGDAGGPFILYKGGWRGVSPVYWPWGGAQGPHAPVGDAFGSISDPGETSDLTLYSQGTTAIARCLPTNPSFNAAQAIGELREGLPKLVLSGLFKQKVKRAVNAGDEYLNVEFGWKPLMSDFRKALHAIKNSDQIIASYKRGSDKKIKRRYDYPSTNTTTSASGAGEGIFLSGGYQSWGRADILNSVKSETWFEGCFRYHVPVPDTTMGAIREHAALANKVLGLRLTPELVWNLTPWSWMADWFGNTGDVLRNISALGHDGLVMQYGYIMSKSDNYRTRTMYDGNLGQASQSTEYYRRLKRLPATPFGFGVDLNALSAKQIAIVAALGLSKGGRPWNEQK
jgi:hypothetical protein